MDRNEAYTMVRPDADVRSIPGSNESEFWSTSFYQDKLNKIRQYDQPSNAPNPFHAMSTFYVPESWGQWVTVSILLSSFAVLINNTNSLDGGEPRVATFMLSLAIFIMVAMTPISFIHRWNYTSKVLMSFMIIIALALLAAMIWLLIRIWVKF